MIERWHLIEMMAASEETRKAAESADRGLVERWGRKLIALRKLEQIRGSMFGSLGIRDIKLVDESDLCGGQDPDVDVLILGEDIAQADNYGYGVWGYYGVF